MSPDAQPALGGALEYPARVVETIAGVEHQFNPQPVARPLLDLVEVAVVRDQRLVGFFVRPIAHCDLALAATIIRHHSC